MLVMTNINDIVPIAKQALKVRQFWGTTAFMREGWSVQDHVITGNARLVDAQGKALLHGTIAECAKEGDRLAPSWRHKKAVMLLHCLSGRPFRFMPMANGLAEQGFAVANIAYPNLFQPLEDHVKRARGIIDKMAEDGIEEVSFAGHSIGGLVIRGLLQEKLSVRVGRVLKLGTPEQGSSFAKTLKDRRAFQSFYGPSGQQMVPEAVKRLPISDVETLMIAGGTGGRGYNPLLKGDNDGWVTVEETRAPGAHHHVIPCLHPLLPRHRKAQRAGIDFLTKGLTP
jgi:hypothetical protein